MRNLTPEQIGLDYPALLELLGKERALNLIGKERALNVIGKEQALDLIGKERALDLIGKERALDLIGEAAVRQWLQRHEQAAAQGPATLPPSAPLPGKPDGADQN